MQYLTLNVLSSNRISAQSLGLSCITSAIDINPETLLSLECIVPFLQAQDPKLRSSVSKVVIIFTCAHVDVLLLAYYLSPALIFIVIFIFSYWQ